ncbi:hypothetical protein CYMTET_15043 [Cymbomonas tetramitiformis]|uniref:Uncharacterized protein n=1 Tax=Cymbomonas tetramitiformis TaxID=36881 RepID=A0AAE0L9B4_9CHLO|nr:hypothetical protein CYMTET_15043 [Cymbomonas tetramitiformis]
MSIRWCGELGDGQCTELATRMQAEVHGAVGVSPRQLRAEQVKAQKLREFGGREGREWLPASEESVRLHIGSLLPAGTLQAASMQLYIYFGDRGSGGSSGREQDCVPARHVRTVHKDALMLLTDSDEDLRWLRED